MMVEIEDPHAASIVERQALPTDHFDEPLQKLLSKLHFIFLHCTTVNSAS